MPGHPGKGRVPPEVAGHRDSGGQHSSPCVTPDRREVSRRFTHGSGVPSALVPTMNVRPFALRYIARSTTSGSGPPTDSTSTPAIPLAGSPASVSSSASGYVCRERPPTDFVSVRVSPPANSRRIWICPAVTPVFATSTYVCQLRAPPDSPSPSTQRADVREVAGELCVSYQEFELPGHHI